MYGELNRVQVFARFAGVRRSTGRYGPVDRAAMRQLIDAAAKAASDFGYSLAETNELLDEYLEKTQYEDHVRNDWEDMASSRHETRTDEEDEDERN